MKILIANAAVVQLTLEVQGVVQSLEALEANNIVDSSFMAIKFLLEKLLAMKKSAALEQINKNFSQIKFTKIEISELGNGTLVIIAHQEGDCDEDNKIFLEEFREDIENIGKDAERYRKWISIIESEPSKVATAICNCLYKDDYDKALDSI